ncbi:MAG: pilin, partial [Patescibacteria group bacterium]
MKQIRMEVIHVRATLFAFFMMFTLLFVAGIRTVFAACDGTDACVSECPTGSLTKGVCKGKTGSDGKPLVCCIAPKADDCPGSCSAGTTCGSGFEEIPGKKCPTGTLCCQVTTSPTCPRGVCMANRCTGNYLGLKEGSCPSKDGVPYYCCFIPEIEAAAAAASKSAPPPNSLCFTQDQCTAPEYGGHLDRFVSGQGCPAGQGKCLAPETEIELSFPILGQKTVQGFRAFVFLLFRFALSILVITAAVVFVWAGFRYIIGASFGDIKAAKEWMVNATIGLLLAFGAILLLRTLNPATTRFEAIPIFLINKQEFSLLNRCADSKSKDGKAAQFADAGQPVGQIPFSPDPKKFTIPAETTECGKDYYIQGTTGQTCKGSICKDKDKICNVCAGQALMHIPECAGKRSTDMTCMKAIFAGTVTWKDTTYPVSMFLIPVCQWAQPKEPKEWTSSDVKKNLGASFLSGWILNQSTEATGITGYGFNLQKNYLDDMWNDCLKRGKLNGVVLGVVYKDHCSALRAALKAKSTLKGVDASKIEAAAVATSCLISPNDILIVTKNDCTNNPNKGNKANSKYFSSYLDQHDRDWFDNFVQIGTASLLVPATESQEDLAARAIYCGWRVNPGAG